jgi:hypothetical protein
MHELKFDLEKLTEGGGEYSGLENFVAQALSATFAWLENLLKQNQLYAKHWMFHVGVRKQQNVWYSLQNLAVEGSRGQVWPYFLPRIICHSRSLYSFSKSQPKKCNCTFALEKFTIG